MNKLTGIDPSTWQVHLLPHPKRTSRSKALGFCAGRPVGVAESGRGKPVACWWPGDAPELLTLPPYKDCQVLFARGDAIPGSWSAKGGERVGAVVWRPDGAGLVGTDLHPAAYERSWAEGTGGGLVVGVGVPKGKLGQRGPDVGLVWGTDGTFTVLAHPAGDVCLRVTDGVRCAGHVGGRATLWPDPAGSPVDLQPAGMSASEVHALDGDTQAGFGFTGFVAHALVWHGSAGSAVDLTPKGQQEARVLDAARGFQVGLVRKRSTTRNGSSACDDHAALWQGAADRWFDLNSLLPEPYNSSVAWSACVVGDTLTICGEASRVEVSDPGTRNESHFVPLAQAVLWTVRLAD